MVEAYQHLQAPELDGLAGRVTEVLRTGKPPVEWGGKVRPLYKNGDHLRPETRDQYAVPSRRPSSSGW